MRPTTIFIMLMTISGLLAAAAPANATAYTFMTLQVPGTPTAPSPFPTNLGFPAAINNLGQVVGSYSKTNIYNDLHGYLYQNGTYTPINAYGASYVSANGINDLGQIVGTYAGPFPNYSAPPHAYLDTNGVFQTLDKPGAASTLPNAINDAGEIVGRYDIPNANTFRSYFYQNGVFTDINPFGQTQNTFAVGINNSGEIVGDILASQSFGAEYGYLYANGIFTKIQVPIPGSYTIVRGIDDIGQIIGDYYINNVSNGFVYDNGAFSYFTQPELTRAIGINDAGQVIAGLNSGGILATPVGVAEPTSFALFGFGMLGLVLVHSRRNWQDKHTIQP